MEDNNQDFYHNPLKLRFTFEASDSEETYGITKYHIDIYKYGEEMGGEILIGKMDAYKFERVMITDNIFDVLDYESDTAPFMEIFENDGTYKNKVLKAADADEPYFDLLILNRLEILPEFRGNEYAGYVFDLVGRTIASNTITAMIAFPLQLENKGQSLAHFGEGWRDKMNFSEFERNEKKATRKLTKYYGNFGFRKVLGCSKNILVTFY